MPAFFIGGYSSLVGEARVGEGFVFTSVGSILFSGQATRRVSRTAVGNILFSGTATRRVDRPSVGLVTFEGRAGKQYRKTYTGFVAFSGAASGSFSGSISVRSSSGGITFEGTGAAFKFKSYNTNISQLYHIGVGYVGAIELGVPQSVHSLHFIGKASLAAQSTKKAVGEINFNSSALRAQKRVVTASQLNAFIFTGTAATDRTIRGNIWATEIISSIPFNEGASSIWEADAILDAATAPALPAVVAGSVTGSDNIWGTA